MAPLLCLQGFIIAVRCAAFLESNHFWQNESEDSSMDECALM